MSCVTKAKGEGGCHDALDLLRAADPRGCRISQCASDQTSCPLSSGTPPNEVPHVGGPILTGSATVMIGGRPAARVGDSNVENGPPDTIITGALTVLIGP